MISEALARHEYYEIALIHALIGSMYLLCVLRIGLGDVNIRASEIDGRVGMLILLCVIAWPYSLFCWIFSWRIWLMPVGKAIDLILRKIFFLR